MRRHPRRKRRGPIEAPLASSCVVGISTHPRRKRRGPIEAIKLRRQLRLQASIRDGNVAALLKLGRSCQYRRGRSGIRDGNVAALLKQAGRLAFHGRFSRIRDGNVAALLKLFLPTAEVGIAVGHPRRKRRGPIEAPHLRYGFPRNRCCIRDGNVAALLKH